MILKCSLGNAKGFGLAKLSGRRMMGSDFDLSATPYSPAFTSRVLVKRRRMGECQVISGRFQFFFPAKDLGVVEACKPCTQSLTSCVDDDTWLMESLSETKWDVVIAGTGLAQSLLALSVTCL